MPILQNHISRPISRMNLPCSLCKHNCVCSYLKHLDRMLPVNTTTYIEIEKEENYDHI